jgi:hypothetical protein
MSFLKWLIGLIASFLRWILNLFSKKKNHSIGENGEDLTADQLGSMQEGEKGFWYFLEAIVAKLEKLSKSEIDSIHQAGKVLARAGCKFTGVVGNGRPVAKSPAVAASEKEKSGARR